MPKPFGPKDVLQTCGTQRAVRSIAWKNSAHSCSAIDHRFAVCCLSGFLYVGFHSLFREISDRIYFYHYVKEKAVFRGLYLNLLIGYLKSLRFNWLGSSRTSPYQTGGCSGKEFVENFILKGY